MKKSLIIFTLGIVSSVTFISCDKIENPYKEEIELDTTLFTDGNWEDYPWPTFDDNTNTLRNILLEDYTGHKCPNCPKAAAIAKTIEEEYPDRVFSVSIHTSPNGDGAFQALATDCDDPTNVEQAFCHDFTTTEGNTYGENFYSGFGFIGNPQGTLNRMTFSSGDMFLFSQSWETNTATLISENNLKANIQAKSNYYSESNGVYLHIKTDFLEDIESNVSIVTYVVENEYVAWQDSSNVEIEEYHHHNVFLGCIDGQAWGQHLAESPSTGESFETDYSYQLPTGLTNEDIHFLTYVYNTETYEILQVIKHTF